MGTQSIWYRSPLQLLSCSLLLALALPTNALYFYLEGLNPKCFYEELPKDTMVAGACHNQCHDAVRGLKLHGMQATTKPNRSTPTQRRSRSIRTSKFRSRSMRSSTTTTASSTPREELPANSLSAPPTQENTKYASCPPSPAAEAG